MDNNDMDHVPVRDGGFKTNKNKMEERDAIAIRAAQERQMVARWTREDLEDKYLRMYEENMVLKKHARKQEDKIKRMATKLLRLVSDKKKAELHGGVKKVRDIETEEMLEELHGQIRDLENKNSQLKEKLSVTKQQLTTTQNSRPNQYGYIQSRINTGIMKAPGDPRIVKSMRVAGPPPHSARGQSPMPRYGHSLLEETRADNKHLEEQIQQLNEQMNIYEQDIEMLKEQSRLREADYEEDLLKIKQQMSQGQRTAIQENIDIIRLQREVKDKSTKLSQLHAQYSNLEEKLHNMKGSHDSVLYEMDNLNQQLKEEQNRVLALQNELKSGTASQRTIVEYQERVADLDKECEILKEANEKLVSSAFDLEREREWRQRENALKVQIAQLEATLRSDVGEKGTILDRLTEAKDDQEQMQEEHKELRVQYYQLKQEYDELRDKMRFFTKESAVDFQEIEEALMIVKQRKERENQELDFLEKVDDEISKDQSKLIRELQAEHADTINELEKTRNMLIVQHKINKDYQMEVEAVTKKMEENKSEYEAKIDEYAQLLDIRAGRIRKMEAQMRDVAYGTRQFRVRPEEEEGSDVEEIDETLHLERGQNLFEIHVRRVLLSPEGLKQMGDEEPNLFATWEFYEFEIQSTPVMRGPRPDFEFTSQYLCQVDDFFLHYLQKDSCTVELHQSFGTDYRTVAACQLKMREILDRSHGRYHGSVMLTGVNYEGTGMNFGTLEYWVRLRVPMEQALRLYKERSKALGYIDSNLRGTEQVLEALDEEVAKRPPDNINQLRIKLSRCRGVQARRENVQPSPFCVYKFFDYPDHATNTVTGSNSPEYSDHKSYPVPMTADLDKYLKSQQLEVFVFDDTDPDEAAYIGMAKIPLITLAHDKTVKGTFELHNMSGAVNGTVDMHLKWQYHYLPPKASTKTLAQLQASMPEDPEPVHLLPGEEEAMQQSVVSGGPDAQPRPPSTPSSRPPRHRGPSAVSTPQPRIQAEREQLSRAVPAVAIQPATPREEDGLFGQTSSVNMVGTIREETEPEGSIVDEGTPVPARFSFDEEPRGESEDMSDDSEPVTPVADDDEPPSRDATPAAPSMKEAAEKAQRLRDADEEKSPEDLIAEEMGENPPHAEDTMFEEPNNADDEDEDTLGESEIDEEIAGGQRGMGEETGGEETEDSEIVVANNSSRPGSRGGHGQHETVTVMVGHLSLEEHSELMNNEAIKMLYIEYRFLGAPLKETETPYSLPKPEPEKSIYFNFSKVFHVDFENFYERRQYLASMLLPDDPEQGRIRFTVVSEPQNEDDDCADVGVAFVSVRDILEQNCDVIDTDVEIFDVGDETTVVGHLGVTVKCLEALKAVQLEMGTTSELGSRLGDSSQLDSL